jgi:hypothetical protein
MANKGGMFFSMYQREAMWINFESKKSPYLVNIYCGGVNAVSGASPMDTFTAKLRQIKIFTESPERDERLRRLQDYIVLPDQPWLDGFATADGIVKQFVAMPFGSGYSVEAQITGQEVAGGLHFEVTPLRDSYQVFLKMITGGTRTFEVGQHTTVDRLRKLIQRSEGIPPKDQRLIYEGVQLKGKSAGNSLKMQLTHCRWASTAVLWPW